MSVNNKRQRQHVYSISFMKWKLEQRLSTFEQMSIESTLAIHKFGNNPTDANFKKLCESLSDFETMIEVSELTFPALRHNMDSIQKQKLIALKASSKLSNQVDKLEEKAEEEKKVISLNSQTTKKKRSFFDKLLFRNK